MTHQPANLARATVRPAHVKAPAHWAKGDPAPAPQPLSGENAPGETLNPTRYGDWELKGLAIDF